MTPSGTRGVLNDALSIYFADPSLASAFVARWCAGYQVETAGGVFQVREDEPTPQVAATPRPIPCQSRAVRPTGPRSTPPLPKPRFYAGLAILLLLLKGTPGLYLLEIGINKGVIDRLVT
jgi:hypothetical protein